jgi:uncharacterized repeat protein (TIGR03809 family)
LPESKSRAEYQDAPNSRALLASSMSERQNSPYDSIARRWLALVERRHANFIDLYETGRWRHYYTETEFLEEIRKVLRVRDQWAAIAGVSLDADEILPADAAALPRERSAA